MSNVPPSGLLILSVDLELDVPQRVDGVKQQALAETTSRLVELCARLKTPATWGVADPAVSAASERILAGGVGHELAILGDSTWVGDEAGRSRFARELARRTAHARAAKLSVSTLVLRDCELEGNLDLLVKHAITTIRGNSHLDHVAAHAAPRTLRHGLRVFGVSQRLPAEGGMIARYLAARHASRSIDRAASQRGIVHLLIDAQRVAQSPSTLKQLERVLRRAAAHRQREQLEIVSVAQAAVRLARSKSLPPAASILAA